MQAIGAYACRNVKQHNRRNLIELGDAHFSPRNCPSTTWAKQPLQFGRKCETKKETRRDGNSCAFAPIEEIEAQSILSH